MFATCMHCNAALGANDSIEAFPVGRRIAFDAPSGRLWAICRSCERWNLSPFDERWEALEQCERTFRSTRVRVSTDNIGLARLPDGTELVRIGAPLRPEFAAWRYGDQFGRRRRRMAMYAAGGVAGVGLAAAGLLATGAGALLVAPIFQLVNVSLIASSATMSLTPVSIPDKGWFLPVGAPKLVEIPESSEGWGLEVGYAVRDVQTVAPSRSGMWWELLKRRQNAGSEEGRMQLVGSDTIPLLRAVLPRVNRTGASSARIAEGVSMIERAGGSEGFARWAASQRRVWGAQQQFGDTGDLQQIPAAARLALEMSMHEDTERRALEGELRVLEAAWRDADAIAKIADGLVPMPAIDARLAAMQSEPPRKE